MTRQYARLHSAQVGAQATWPFVPWLSKAILLEPLTLYPFVHRLSAICLLCALLVSCATVPQGPVNRSAFRVSASSYLARLDQKLRPDETKSGFRLLSISPFAWDTRLTLIELAEDTIDVQCYELDDDATGRIFLRALRDAAARGVRVRLLVDDWGTTGLDQLLIGLQATPNVEVRLYNPFPHGRAGSLLRLLASAPDLSRVNRRMHNKLLLVDGVAGIVGGRNIGDAYFMRDSDADFVDLETLAMGPVIEQFGDLFDQFWNTDLAAPLLSVVGVDRPLAQETVEFDANTIPDASGYRDPPPAQDLLGFRAISPDLKAGLIELHWAAAFAYGDSPQKTSPSSDKSGLDTIGEPIMRIAHSARSDLVMVSPYFVPSQEGLAQLMADRTRRVHVSVLTNSYESTDEPLVYLSYSKVREKLLEMGLELYEFSPVQFKKHWAAGRLRGSSGRLHEKAIVVDHETVMLGSMNLDPRSAHLNTELELVVIDRDFASETLSLIDRAMRRGSYKLSWNSSTQQIEWTLERDEATTETAEEPGITTMQRWELELLSPLIPFDMM